MAKTQQKDTKSKSKIEEINLDDLVLDDADLEELAAIGVAQTKTKNQKDTPLQSDETDEVDPTLDEFEMWDELEDDLDENSILKGAKDTGLERMPIERDSDKRRLGKGLQKFLDVEVPKEMLD